YTFSWTSGGATDSVFNLPPGQVTVTVTDADGCTTTATADIIEPLPLSVSVTTADVSCSGAADGTATANPSGGTPPYSYQWNVVPVQTAQTAIFLPAGTFSVAVTDANGCVTSGSGTINTNSVINVVVVEENNISCFGFNDGNIEISVNGGIPPYTYDWSHGPNTPAVQNLSPDIYTVTVTDMDNCFVTQTFDITQPPALDASITGVYDVTCDGYSNGIITVSTLGGVQPYAFEWSNATFS